MKYGEEGYVFAADWNGISLTAPSKGQNMIETTDANGVKVVQELIKASKDGGGYVTYIMPPLEGKRSEPKLSYAEPITEWEWYIGTGIYIGDIEDATADRQEELQKQIFQDILLTIVILLILVGITVALLKYFSILLEINLKEIIDFFNKASTSKIPINLAKIRFAELKILAQSANNMVEELNNSNEKLQSIVKKLKKHGEEQEILVKAMVGRELQMKKLKEEIKRLSEK